jgi:UDP-glucose 4-epimerase
MVALGARAERAERSTGRRAVTRADLRGRRALVTGGLGFIGSNLVHALVRAGASVVAFDSLDPACGGNRANLDGANAEVVVADIRSRDALAAAARGVDLVVNCAALTSHAGSMSDPRSYLEVNCVAVLTVLEAVRASAATPRFVQIGSSTQVGAPLTGPVTEEHPEFPLDVYSATKSAAEKLALSYGRAFGIPVSVVRLANVYGPRAKISDRMLGFINYFVGLALRDGELTVFGEGSQRRTITYVDDVVDAIVRVATSDRCAGEVFFATAKGQCTVREAAEAIVRTIGRGRVRTEAWPADRAAIEVGDSVISSAKITRYTGWAASVDLDEGLRRTADYFLPRLDRYLG